MRLMTICAMVLGWQPWQVDFVMAYNHASIEFDIYMSLLAGIEVMGGPAETHVLKLLKKLAGHLAEKLIEAGVQ